MKTFLVICSCFFSSVYGYIPEIQMTLADHVEYSCGSAPELYVNEPFSVFLNYSGDIYEQKCYNENDPRKKQGFVNDFSRAPHMNGHLSAKVIPRETGSWSYICEFNKHPCHIKQFGECYAVGEDGSQFIDVPVTCKVDVVVVSPFAGHYHVTDDGIEQKTHPVEVPPLNPVPNRIDTVVQSKRASSMDYIIFPCVGIAIVFVLVASTILGIVTGKWRRNVSSMPMKQYYMKFPPFQEIFLKILILFATDHLIPYHGMREKKTGPTFTTTRRTNLKYSATGEESADVANVYTRSKKRTLYT